MKDLVKTKLAGQAVSERWDLLLRYRMIEIIALWEGRVTTGHLQNAFGIGRSQASKIIKQYMANVSDSNLYLDRHLKGYAPSKTFEPRVTKGDINEYLNMLDTQSDLTTQFAALTGLPVTTHVISPPMRSVKPEIIRQIIKASREQKRIEIEYSSLTSPKDYRNIAPHTLVFNGYRWHVRAYCEKSAMFKDFVLSRITGIYDFVGDSDLSVAQDDAWNTQVDIVLRPDTRLSEEQQEVIATDYGMTDGRLLLHASGATAQYILQFLRVSTKAIDADPRAQQVIIENMDEVKPWLFD